MSAGHKSLWYNILNSFPLFTHKFLSPRIKFYLFVAQSHTLLNLFIDGSLNNYKPLICQALKVEIHAYLRYMYAIAYSMRSCPSLATLMYDIIKEQYYKSMTKKL